MQSALLPPAGRVLVVGFTVSSGHTPVLSRILCFQGVSRSFLGVRCGPVPGALIISHLWVWECLPGPGFTHPGDGRVLSVLLPFTCCCQILPHTSHGAPMAGSSATKSSADFSGFIYIRDGYSGSGAAPSHLLV